jgi:hypothetical protein
MLLLLLLHLLHPAVTWTSRRGREFVRLMLSSPIREQEKKEMVCKPVREHDEREHDEAGDKKKGVRSFYRLVGKNHTAIDI